VRPKGTPNADNNPVGGQPQSGIWFGKTDDLWRFGKPQGWGGVWRSTAVKAGSGPARSESGVAAYKLQATSYKLSLGAMPRAFILR
jgi:hypothetical protein